MNPLSSWNAHYFHIETIDLLRNIKKDHFSNNPMDCEKMQENEETEMFEPKVFYWIRSKETKDSNTNWI